MRTEHGCEIRFIQIGWRGQSFLRDGYEPFWQSPLRYNDPQHLVGYPGEPAPIMDNKLLLQRWWMKGLVVFAIWTLLGVIDAGQTYFYQLSRGEVIPIWAALVLGVSDWYQWALLTPIIVLMVKRFPLEQPTWDRLLLHALASLVSALLVISLGVPIFQFVSRHSGIGHRKLMTNWELFHLLLAGKLIFYVLTHWLIIGVTHGLLYYRKYQEGALRASQLQTELAQTQLQMLKMQLHPHFLFNTLNAISALMHRDVELADRMVAQLGQLLRTSLDHVGTQEVSLRQELAFIHPYLDIEKARLGSRLTVRWQIDPETLDAQVPNLLLQPLVENAIRHGIAPRMIPGEIEIIARRVDNRLHLEIRDTGPGLPPGPGGALKEGVGVGNTRARLRHLFGDDHRFDMKNGLSGGLTIVVDLPYREMVVPRETVPAVADRSEEPSPGHSRYRERLRVLLQDATAVSPPRSIDHVAHQDADR